MTRARRTQGPASPVPGAGTARPAPRARPCLRQPVARYPAPRARPTPRLGARARPTPILTFRVPAAPPHIPTAHDVPDDVPPPHGSAS